MMSMPGNVWAFVEIAVSTRESQITLNCFAAVTK